MDILGMALCLSIGSAVAWLLALYGERGPRLLLWDVAFSTAGAFLCGLAFVWLAPVYTILGLVAVGPVCALAAISAGHALRRTLWRAMIR